MIKLKFTPLDNVTVVSNGQTAYQQLRFDLILAAARNSGDSVPIYTCKVGESGTVYLLLNGRDWPEAAARSPAQVATFSHKRWPG